MATILAKHHDGFPQIKDIPSDDSTEGEDEQCQGYHFSNS